MTENQNDLQDPAETKRVDVAVETTPQPVEVAPDQPTETVVEKTETVTETPVEPSES